MNFFRSAFCAVLYVSSLAGPAAATDCAQWARFSSTQEYLQPLAVPADRIGSHLSASEWSSGVEIESEMHGDELWIDITSFPGDTTAAAGPRAIMMVGRLADESFSHLVLSDAGTGLFAISEPDIRSIGCQFIWGVEGGQNPIALMREMYAAMTHYGTGQPLSTRWNGNLLGDTTIAINVNNEIVLPGWVMSAVE